MLDPGAQALAELGTTIGAAARHLGHGRGEATAAVDAAQPLAYELAFLAAEHAGLRSVLTAANESRISTPLAGRAAALLLRSARARLDGRRASLGLPPQALAGPAIGKVVAAGLTRTATESVLGSAGGVALPAELALLAGSFRRFGEEHIAPVAGRIHVDDADVPEAIIAGLAALGAFGLSIPAEYGGSRDPEAPGHVPMVVATEELSRASLGAGGSLITRPEILTRALLSGGTEEQRRRWLPAIASGDAMVAVAVTEPDAGSDVAAIRTRAVFTGAGYEITGTKAWCTFAGRAELLMVLARTDPDPATRHRGLSLFVVEKPPAAGREFTVTAGDGRLSGRAIPTLGYRGMHSFDLSFERWPVPAGCRIGGEGDGFALQLEGFAAGRLQTAARAVGLMHAAVDAAAGHAAARRVFGSTLADLGLTRHRLADMRARVAACRLLTHDAATSLDGPDGQFAAAVAKALACRAAEEVTRDAMQFFGGSGYAADSAPARHWVDARVLSIFEGAEEVLALRVIARRLVAAAMG